MTILPANTDQATAPFPITSEDERPAEYADRVGRWYAAGASEQHKKHNGQYLTQVAVARFMALSAALNSLPSQGLFFLALYRYPV